MTKQAVAEKKLFKDWFDRHAAQALADQIHHAWPAFNRKTFIAQATRNLAALEFNGRVQQFSDALAGTLPADRDKALRILTKSLPPTLPGCEAVTDGWLQWPVGQFIADHGLPHFETSMTAMIELTKRFSSEFAVRPFVEAYPAKTLARLLALTRDPNPHVRRWCSEGSRPRLPWGKRLYHVIENPDWCWPILEALKDDPERYVQKSVANHLNDIGKDHPDLLMERCRAWAIDATPARTWIIKHALRSLIKAGHPEALAFMGYDHNDNLKARLRLGAKQLRIGESIPLTATLHNQGTTSVQALLDYVVYYVHANGSLSSGKVFKWTTCVLHPDEKITLNKKHAFRPASVRALYPGPHRIELQINGHRQTPAVVQLIA